MCVASQLFTCDLSGSLETSQIQSPWVVQGTEGSNAARRRSFQGLSTHSDADILSLSSTFGFLGRVRRPTPFPSIREPRAPARRTPYEGEFDDIPASVRPILDPGRSQDEPKPAFNEYFLPGDGIDRELLQIDICRYLGQDALVRPGTHNDVYNIPTADYAID